VRLAEDLAVLDNLSNGRIEIGVGMGYAPHEFKGFGLPVSRRVSLTDEGIEVLRLCFAGERFSYHGKRYDFDEVVIRPGYVQKGGPPLWIAAMSGPGAQRAARYDSNFLPQGPRSAVLDPWRATMRESGRDPETYRVGIIRSCLVTDDRERDWPAVRAAERYRGQVYRSFNSEGAYGGVQQTATDPPIPQTWVVGDVEHCVKELAAFIKEYGITDLVTWAVPPGMRPDQMNGHLERFVRDVAPRLKAAVAKDLGQ
jgi:alkanesulfonate monooxygenase SsuD/methylene tetrahydromethanopterin reductase-like flavin-dependent oxidoreductase (luciferase family)